MNRIEKINKYRTSDGKEFKTIKEAEEHQKKLKKKEFWKLCRDYSFYR